MDKKQSILQEIRRVANEIAPESLTQRSFSRNANVSLSSVRRTFGAFSEAVKAAGLVPNEPGSGGGRQRLEDDVLLKELGRVWSVLGNTPTEAAFEAHGEFSMMPYRKRWGSLARALDEYVSRFGVPSPTPDLAERNHYMETLVAEAKPPPRPVVVPKTHKPSAVAGRERTLYGEPIDFRGLRFAPINEQGVVYLFGMVSRELGFLIESVRTDFPDCEGKRSTNKDATRWEHIKIEFEYRSKNFREHGHNPDDCDLIVCWIHDWKDCPLEVLELRGVLPSLSKDL